MAQYATGDLRTTTLHSMFYVTHNSTKTYNVLHNTTIAKHTMFNVNVLDS